MNNRKLSVAIIGCGAITQMGHLPGIGRSDLCRVEVLVDVDLKQAQLLAEEFDVGRVQASLDGLGDLVDVAVVAVPHRLHADVVTNLLKQGIHVLVEKPMAISSSQASLMKVEAEESFRTLGVAMVRRFFRNDQFVKQLLSSNWFGELKSFHIEDGREFAWPVRTSFLLDPDGGGGILIGNGSHVFDLVRWWFGEVTTIKCQLNSMIKLETDALIELKLESGLEGSIELSRTRELSNEVTLVFEKVTVVVPQVGDVRIHGLDDLFDIQGVPRLYGSDGSSDESLEDLMRTQIDNFVTAIHENREPEVDALDGLKTIELVEKCYEHAEPMKLSWDRQVLLGTGS